ncbi:ECF transporter S component [Egicoccus sp. AB-alg6-2]|uniref:ECF transporter S component n=1 Tax=Egicoccus sp. AB-alg6-2 TaxID=3242692 RepID=UPI00359DDA6E
MTATTGTPPAARPRPSRSIRLRPRAAAAVLLASIVGLAAFAWPLLVDPGTGIAHLREAPLLFTVLLPLVLLVVLSEIADGGIDAKAVAMLGVLTAVGAALRPLGTGVAGFEPVFFLLVLAGRVHGPGFGFVLGATTLFASALTTGGVGPWLPFQMLGAAWVAAGAGLLPPMRGRAELALLAAYGLAAGLLYGLLLNLSFWPFTLPGTTAISFVPGDPLADNLRRFLAFSALTSLGFDVPRALVTAGLVLLTGRPLLRAMRRASRKAAFDVPVAFDVVPGPRASGPRAAGGRGDDTVDGAPTSDGGTATS